MPKSLNERYKTLTWVYYQNFVPNNQKTCSVRVTYQNIDKQPSANVLAASGREERIFSLDLLGTLMKGEQHPSTEIWTMKYLVKLFILISNNIRIDEKLATSGLDDMCTYAHFRLEHNCKIVDVQGLESSQK